MRCYNPFSFVPRVVTIVTAIIYLVVLTPILVIHETVPPALKNPTLYRGLNLTEAWLDLQELSNGYHPFNSRRNDEVRDWLLRRIEAILDKNGVQSFGEGAVGVDRMQASQDYFRQLSDQGISTSESADVAAGKATAIHEDLRVRYSSPAATIFNDLTSNYTSTALTSIGVSGRRAGISTYFEGSNIIVYIRGTEDEEGDWWRPSPPFIRYTHGKGGVMVNAHFDSVSTGYGATDDGIGVITALQLVRYFTTTENTPKKGVVALFNNGEEDGLYGAKAFLLHPLSSFVHTFLNLEGAGAGGRATLFRSTDTEVTRAYGSSPHPFGSVISADGFALGFVRSETDYVVFRGEGYRGLDVAFWEPRARYHTDQDDAKHTSKDSLWHMLSASVETMKYLANSDDFVGPRGDNAAGKVKNGHGSDGVWFDIFGRFFAVFRLRTLFAWSLTLLIASPLILMIVSFILARNEKYYLFTGSFKSDVHQTEVVPLDAWCGAFTFPVAFIVSTTLTVLAAFFIRKFNPFIIYSSPYAVWAMSLGLFYSVFWFIMAFCNAVWPSALQRTYVLIWMFVLGWFMLVAATVFEDRYKIGGGYLFVIYESAIFLATLISLCELFALPTKLEHHRMVHGRSESRAGRGHDDPILGNWEPDGRRNIVREAEPREADERTPLVSVNDDRRRADSLSWQWSRIWRRSVTEPTDDSNHCRPRYFVFGGEQKWSARLPSWTWLLQFLLIGPFTLIILGQVGLLLVTATAQTGTDGSPLLLPYLIVALFSILLLLPLAPFIHRITPHIPIFLFIVFVGTLVYNLLVFPFSENNRYKAYFQQTVDLDSGINHVTLVGIEDYVRNIISYIPSAAGQDICCTNRPTIRDGLRFCSYEGLAPKVVDNVKDGIPAEKGYSDWLTYNVTRPKRENKATFHISGKETKACIIRFDDPFTAFTVNGAASSNGNDVPDSGSDQIKLWHRDWDREWVVDVEWPASQGKQLGDEGRSGRVVCLWSDHNKLGTIPALDEVQRFAPKWTSIVKVMDGLVEGSKAFTV